MRIAVAGGTGVVGQHVVAAITVAGHEPVVLARSTGVDVLSGRGLDDAVAGAEVVVDVSNVVTTSRRTAEGFFTAATTNLLAAGRRAGVQHHVTLSIVGVDRVDVGYYLAKRAQEELVLSARTSSSVLRTTQFHEFAAQLLDRGWGPVVPVPRMRVQPVSAREAAQALVDVAIGPARGLAQELAGPDEHEVVDLVRQVSAVSGGARLLVPVRVPGGGGRAMATGALLPTRPDPRGRETFATWLARAYPARRTT